MVKDKSQKAGNGVRQNGQRKPPVEKKHKKTQTSRDFCSQITRAELATEMEEIDRLQMTGLVMEHNGFKVRRPRPQKRDAITMTSRDVSTQIKKDTLIAVRQEVTHRGQSQVGPVIVAFKPKQRKPKYVRPRPPQRSVKTQTSRDFSSQVTAAEIKETVATALEQRAVLNEFKTAEPQTTDVPEAQENEESGVISEEWTLEIVDDAGLNATIVNGDEAEALIENAETQNVDTNGVDNPAFDEEKPPEDAAVDEVVNEMESLAVNGEGDDEDSEEEYSTYL
ncbi:uncharacterized protein [Ptychodera flava]|uniref:uncharacterized protein n=1 Tax=Ptychodera flava TaxID=63121 RepID=UPI00396A6E9A